MSSLTPYTFIQCPCSDAASTVSPRPSAGDGSPTQEEQEEDDDRTFDPRAPRSNYSLYPLEYLLYCEDCQQIRCPRCVAEEIVTYYCPNCLFEVPTSNIKSEGNRCTRSCFQCPICIGPLSVTNLETAPTPNLLAPDSAAGGPPQNGPYVLTCSYCQWSSAEIGVKFDKSNGIYAQLAKLRNGGKTRLTPKERKDRRKDASAAATGSSSSSSSLRPSSVSPPPPPGGDDQPSAAATADDEPDIETHFAALKQFYQTQIAETSGTGTGGLSSLGDLGFSSPGSLSRIMSLYTTGSLHDKRAKSRVGTMREAADADEGLKVARLDEDAAIERLRRCGWDGTVSTAQREAQPPNVGEPDLLGRSRFADELRPIPYLLRTKRSKRCPVCRHIISKPESKVTSTRFRIRLVAGSYIPSISIRPLPASASSSASQAAAAAALSNTNGLLAPLKPVQYLLTFKNPIFETVKVTLATPATTPGRFASKVTVLCPQFEIDANTDVWDEALKDGDRDRRRRGEDGHHQQAEAGKIWERGRNWVSIVVEVVPASLRLDDLALAENKEGGQVDLSALREDEDVLEIPMFVRIEWEADPAHDEMGAAPGRDKDAKEKRELAYWCVLGIGRIARD